MNICPLSTVLRKNTTSNDSGPCYPLWSTASYVLHTQGIKGYLPEKYKEYLSASLVSSAAPTSTPLFEETTTNMKIKASFLPSCSLVLPRNCVLPFTGEVGFNCDAIEPTTNPRQHPSPVHLCNPSLACTTLPLRGFISGLIGCVQCGPLKSLSVGCLLTCLFVSL
ncbi:hypothetical protein BDQ17DRAFT_1086233 [Cyathus striatus]|nr:hypothetical protein BDQ17DRAFT_1086233 [Cyathus striatus]